MNAQVLRLPSAAREFASHAASLASLGIIQAGSPGCDTAVKAGLRDLQPNEGAVAVDPRYVWRLEAVRNMTGFWNMGSRSAVLIGPSGSGKTTLVEQWHACLRWPLFAVTGHERFSFEDAIGGVVPTETGGLVFKDGPLLTAARTGTSFLFNEINACPPEAVIALNDIAQKGSTITIPFTGESVVPQPGFRVFATKNPEGTVYAGRQAMDTSTRHRFKNYVVGFPCKEDEIMILKNVFESLGFDEDKAALVAPSMVEVANSIRPRCKEVSQAPDAIPEVISTRILVSWAEEWVVNARRPGAVHAAMRIALTNGSDPVSAAAIHDQIELVFGVDENGQHSKKSTSNG